MILGCRLIGRCLLSDSLNFCRWDQFPHGGWTFFSEHNWNPGRRVFQWCKDQKKLYGPNQLINHLFVYDMVHIRIKYGYFLLYCDFTTGWLFLCHSYGFWYAVVLIISCIFILPNLNNKEHKTQHFWKYLTYPHLDIVSMQIYFKYNLLKLISIYIYLYHYTHKINILTIYRIVTKNINKTIEAVEKLHEIASQIGLKISYKKT